jgi:TonB family protein
MFLEDFLEGFMRNFLMIVLTVTLLTSPIHTQQIAPTADPLMLTRELVAKGITPPEPLSKVEAEYPDDARSQHLNGLCNVQIVVDVQGNPQNVRIIHCTESVFEQSSLNAAKQYRFKPAVTQEGKPVAVAMYIQTQFRLMDISFRHRMSKAEANREINKLIHYGFIPQRGGTSEPDPDGVYPFTRNVTGPRVIEFSDEGYGLAAFAYEGSGACDIVLTVSTDGKAIYPQMTHCERPELEKPAIDSLLKSKYKSGFVNGKPVAMRASIHLEYGDVAAKP